MLRCGEASLRSASYVTESRSLWPTIACGAATPTLLAAALAGPVTGVTVLLPARGTLIRVARAAATRGVLRLAPPVAQYALRRPLRRPAGPARSSVFKHGGEKSPDLRRIGCRLTETPSDSPEGDR